MIRITIRDLHMKTGQWVRKAAHAGNVVVMDRDKPIAKLVPFTAQDNGRRFAERRLIKGFAELPRLHHDSSEYVSEDRDRA
jgi:antitoxin (DNA-binding transcriptional repressor) of toxin-antitoxin stability system